MSAPDHLGEKLSAYLDGELPAEERTAADQHLRECASCAQLLEELAAVDTASRTLAVEAPAGYFDAFPSRVRARLRARRAPRIPAWTWAAAAAVLLAVLTPLTLQRRSAPSDAPAVAQVKDELRLRRMQEAPTAAPAAAPPTTLADAPKERVAGFGDTSRQGAEPESKLEFAQKRDAARDDRLGERDADRPASGAVGGIAGPGRFRADQKDGELKKEALADKGGAEKLKQNAAPPPVGALAIPPPPAAAEPEAQRAMGADESMKEAVTRRAEATPAAPPATAEAPPAQGSAAKPSPREGIEMRSSKAAGAPTRTIPAEEAVFAHQFEALASQPVRNAEEARTASRRWSELARRHPAAPAADEARVRAVETLVTAWRLERRDADRDQARRDAEAYLAGSGPQKDRVRALVQALER